jgi:hypothetical protein
VQAALARIKAAVATGWPPDGDQAVSRNMPFGNRCFAACAAFKCRVVKARARPDFHSGVVPPVDPAGSCYAVGMFEGDLAPTSTRRATNTAFEQRQRKRAATRAHQRCEKARHCTPHTLIALRHKGSGSRKTTAPSANEKAAHRPSAGRARIMGARFLTYFSLAQLFRLRLHFTRRATTPRRETVPT